MNLAKAKTNSINRVSGNRRSTYAKLSSELPDIFLNRQTDGWTETDRDREKGRGLVDSYAF